MTPTPDLKAAALAATKGEWRFSRDKAGVICDTVVEHNGRSLEIRQSIVQAAQYGNRHNDMAFIIAASPTTILALLERLQVAEDAALPDVALCPACLVEVEKRTSIADTTVIQSVRMGISAAIKTAEQTGSVEIKLIELYRWNTSLVLPLLAAPPSADAKDAGFRWDLFASYLLDKCEGKTITEQNLQGWTAEMVQSDWYKERIAS